KCHHELQPAPHAPPELPPVAIYRPEKSPRVATAGWREGSGEAHHPAVVVLAAAVLDVGELLAEAGRQGTGGCVERPDGEVARLQHPDRCDDRGGAAGEDL